jgi:membrane-bound lytic murein transglycosylase MltF
MRRSSSPLALLAAALLACGMTACGEGDAPSPPAASAPATEAAAPSPAATPGESPTVEAREAPAGDAGAAAEDATSDDPLISAARVPWKGDLDAIVERGLLRVGLPYGLSTYFLDGPTQRGIGYERVQSFEKSLLKRLGKNAARLKVLIVPANRSRLLAMLDEGLIDVAAGNITVTPQRAEALDFSAPFRTDVRQVLVLGPAAPEVASAEDMLASEVHVLPGSSYREYIAALNARRTADGRAAFPVVETDPNLTPEDLIEMVAAGIVPATVTDQLIAEFFVPIFPTLKVREDIVLASGQQIAWAMRKGSPLLKEAVDDFVGEARKGTTLGNVLLNKYLKDQKWAKNALAAEDLRRFEAITQFLKTYAGRYDFDWLMVAAQGYQESGLDQAKRSRVGAIGVMQLMPATARDPNVGIPEIDDPEKNIHAGVKYLRFLRDRYYSDPAITPLNQALFSFAAYNAGPGNIARARKRATTLGLDPNVWFDNVEIATAKTVSREPVVYVRNIYKYYVAYKTITQQVKPSAQAAPG